MKSYETRPRENGDEVDGSLVEAGSTAEEETAGIGVIDDEVDSPGAEITNLNTVEASPTEIEAEQPPRYI